MGDDSGTDSKAQHRAMAVKLYNETWSLLDEPSRTGDQDREMLAAAFGSMYHWSLVGDERNFAISDWQVARVLATVGQTDLAQQFADQALRRAIDGNLGPFLIGCGHEVLARVAAAKGDDAARQNHLARADDILSIIEDEEERDVLKADLDSLR